MTFRVAPAGTTLEFLPYVVLKILGSRQGADAFVAVCEWLCLTQGADAREASLLGGLLTVAPRYVDRSGS